MFKLLLINSGDDLALGDIGGGGGNGPIGEAATVTILLHRFLIQIHVNFGRINICDTKC